MEIELEEKITNLNANREKHIAIVWLLTCQKIFITLKTRNDKTLKLVNRITRIQKIINIGNNNYRNTKK